MKRLSIITFIFLVAVLSACGGNANAEPTPPDIHYGDDICEFCGMIISEQGYAAGFVTADGHGHSFDDIGDMIQADLELQEDVSAYFVHDFASQEWIRAETAHYVQAEDLLTPMLSGIVAFASLEDATAFAKEKGGQVLDFEALFSRYQ